jgi:hypothetical protein
LQSKTMNEPSFLQLGGIIAVGLLEFLGLCVCYQNSVNVQNLLHIEKSKFCASCAQICALT